LEIAEAFFAASRDGDMERLRALLAADVTVYADGGGKVPAGTVPVVGLDDVMRLFATFAPAFAASRSHRVRYGLINGLPGLPSSGATFSRRPPWRSSVRALSPSMSCVIPISSGTWQTPCIDALARNHEVAVGPLIPKFVSDRAVNARKLRNPTTSPFSDSFDTGIAPRDVSPAGLTRGSIAFVRTFHEEDGLPGQARQ